MNIYRQIRYHIKVNSLYFKISSVTAKEVTSSVYDDATKISHKNVWMKKPEKENTRCYVFACIKLGDSRMKLH